MVTTDSKPGLAYRTCPVWETQQTAKSTGFRVAMGGPYYGSNFWSERRIGRFLSKMIGPDGGCVLRVNPENPLEADFTGKNVKKFSQSGKEGPNKLLLATS